MQRITFITVGQIKTPWIRDGLELYTSRIAHAASFEHRSLAAGKPQDEHIRLEKALAKIAGSLVLLDERGKSFSSEGFASLLGGYRDRGEPVTFVIGGAYGFSEALRKRAGMLLSLSPMTLPHELCALFFLEQLYRGFSILSGSGYHHG